MVVRVKRIYAPAASDDGFRVLVDRIWPRGIKKADTAIDLWLKEVAPSTELRRWFAHDPAKWAEFRKRYAAELAQQSDAMALLLRCCTDPAGGARGRAGVVGRLPC
jgi:uncharacterized protein YeaO (DUF488 family)